MGWTTSVPPVGTECLCRGIAHGDYGYTEDEVRVYRCIVTEPIIEDGETYPSVRVLEATPRYWAGFSPQKYLIIKEKD